MTDRDIDKDLLGDEDREAELYYRGTRSKKDKSKGASGPVPLAAGGSGAGGAAAPAAPPAAAGAGAGGAMANAPVAPMAAGGVTLGAVAAPEAAASGDVRFDADQLSAGGGTAPETDDPWGAYDNPDGVPGLSLDDEDDQRRDQRGGMAMRGSGTRGKGSGGGAGMAPMVPMGGAGTGTAGAGAAAVPGATVGGVGAMPNLAVQQQQAAVQGVMASAQQGSVPLSALNSMNVARASNAMTAPPASGVMAAGSGGVTVDSTTLDETLHRMGFDSNSPHLVGPDGNLYPNPHYQGPGDTGGSVGGTAPWRGGDVGGGGVGGPTTPGTTLPADGTPGGYDNDVIRPQPGITGPGSGGVTGPGSGGGSGSVTGPGTGGGAGAGSGSGGGVSHDVGNLNSGSYQAPAGSPSTGGGGGTGISGGGWSSPAPSTGSNPFTRSYSGTSIARGTNFTVTPDELRGEAREWERLADEQAKLAQQFKSLPNPDPIFGVLRRMVTPYNGVQQASVEAASEHGDDAGHASATLDQTAITYDANEHDGATTAEGMNY
ncbi:MAG: hypothetical protein GX596_11765 [Propionibacterium sp.]|nr:hypothetical protein [Propionibacterium sp.]